MPRQPAKRNGSITPLMVVFMVVIMIFSGITVNYSWIQYHKINAKTAADLTARSTLQQLLSDTDYDSREHTAREMGAIIFDLNRDDRVSFDSDRIKFGEIEDIDEINPVFIEAHHPTDVISAVYVTPPTDDSEKQVNIFFSNLLGGRETIAVSSEAKAATIPVDIMLCLDASRSMNRKPDGSAVRGYGTHGPPGPGSRWYVLTDTVALFLDAVKDINTSARVGLVTFGGGGTAPASRGHSPLDDDEARFENALTSVLSPNIDELNQTLRSYITDYPALGWGTRIGAGINLCVPNFDRRNTQKHILLLGDGASPVTPTLNAARNAAANDIRVHSISFGGSFGILEDAAIAGEGMFFVAETEEELKEAFRAFLGNLKASLVD